MTHDDRSIRFAAESLYQNANNMYRQYPSIDFCKNILIANSTPTLIHLLILIPARSSQTHSINLYTEDFLAGFMQDGRMSVVRRFFCLFVTFDLALISLLWLICILVRTHFWCSNYNTKKICFDFSS